MKYLALTATLCTILSTSASFGGETDTSSILRRINLANGERASQNLSTPVQKQVELIGGVCRNGAYYCVGVGAGPVGYSCCGCGFCGWWSTN
jgi:hypothetical protein